MGKEKRRKITKTLEKALKMHPPAQYIPLQILDFDSSLKIFLSYN